MSESVRPGRPAEALVLPGGNSSQDRLSLLSVAMAPLGRGFQTLGRWARRDPRVAVAGLLFGYLLLGFTVLGFNRTPAQVVLTTVSACLLEVVLGRAFKGVWRFPFSAMITSFSLSILLNYAHDHFILLVPVFFAIGSKYIFTFDGRHVFNPALSGVTLSLIFFGDLITAAPAYQWNGIEGMSVFMGAAGLLVLLPQARRGWLVGSFLISFALLTALRAWIMRWHLPFETLFLGTMSSPSFFLFTFFMITDPATSPAGRRDQVTTGVAIAVVDLLFHLVQSYFTFFYAAFSVAAFKLVWRHVRALHRDGLGSWFLGRFAVSGYWKRPIGLGALALAGAAIYSQVIRPTLEIADPPLRLVRVPESRTGILPDMGRTFERLDPRIHHVAKWLMSVGDSVAVGDVDADGRPDLFFTFPLKSDEHRLSLYRNLGDFRFERVLDPTLEPLARKIERYGLATGAYFVDLDEDGDQDLFLTVAGGPSRLLENRLIPEERLRFEDVSEERGLTTFHNAMGGAVLDANADGRLDLLVANVLPRTLPGYSSPTRLNLFRLPDPEYPGDVRMFRFMHSSWHQSANGGKNDLFLQMPDGRFERQDSEAWGLTETMWSLAIGAVDLNQDGLTDLYVANDFGPDDLYLNRDGRRFEAIRGGMFGEIGRDTYKGMNASVEDVDNDGWFDVYVSNVHHALQAEGSLLWSVEAREGELKVHDRAGAFGVLNPKRFGWGAALADFDNDGWIDVLQANGMVDDFVDRRFDRCPDYWYVNEKIARSPPSIHVRADLWGDIRGRCIYGNEPDRLYLNREAGRSRRFVDVSDAVGLIRRANSRGVAAVDLNQDGRLDAVVTHQFRRPSVLENWLPEGHDRAAYIRLRLQGDGERCGRDAVGSRVRLKVDGAPPQVREVQVSTGFNAQGERVLHFGVGEVKETAKATIEVHWCGRFREVFTGLTLNRTHVLRSARDRQAASAL